MPRKRSSSTQWTVGCRSSREQTKPTVITTAAPTNIVGSGPPWAKPIAVDHRPDGLAEIEEARMQRRRGAARGLRELGDMDLDAAVQEIEAEPEHGEDGDLHIPREMQRDEDEAGRGKGAAGQHQAALRARAQ